MVTQTAVMTVKVLCFAQLRDQLGASDLTVLLPSDATGRELLDALRQRNPRIGPLLGVSRLAVNQEYVAADVRLQDGDEVVVIPPVSGG
jgi:molybdopterin synthase sulfur carrier subunit